MVNLTVSVLPGSASGPSPSLAARKNIAYTSNGLDVLIVLGVAQLFADLADVHIDAAIEGRKLAAEHGIHQPFARHHASGLAQQHFQQIELDRSQIHGLAFEPNGPGCGIQLHVADADDIRRRTSRLSPRVRRSTARMRATSSRGLNGFGR